MCGARIIHPGLRARTRPCRSLQTDSACRQRPDSWPDRRRNRPRRRHSPPIPARWRPGRCCTAAPTGLGSGRQMELGSGCSVQPSPPAGPASLPYRSGVPTRRKPLMRTRMPSLRPLVVAVVVLGLAGCAGYVKRDEFDATIAELRATDQQQQQRLDQLQALMEQRFGEYDARISQVEGRLRVETTAHFAVDDATLRDADKPMLDDFARVIRDHHPGVVVTVEGFTDPSGSAAYNKRLGQRRADAVRDYLVTQGLPDAPVRAVAYGEARNRQVRAGATGEQGRANRRVALVIDFAEAVAAR